MDADSLKWRLGCALLLCALCAAPFLLMGGVDDGDREPEAGTPAAIARLRVSRNQPEEALAACRAALAQTPPGETQTAFREELTACLEALYRRACDAKEFAKGQAFLAELRRDHPDAKATARVLQRWRVDAASFLKQCVDQGDLATARPLAEELLADPKWHPVAYDDPVILFLGRHWRAEFDRAGLDAAAAVFQSALADLRCASHHRLARERHEFLVRAFEQARADGDRAAADRRFQELADNAAVTGSRLDLRPFADYLRERTLAEGESFLAALKDLGDGPSTNERTGVMKPIYMAWREAQGQKLAEAGDFAAAERLLTEPGAFPYYLDHTVQDAQLAELRLRRWRAARLAGRADEARQTLETVIARQAHRVDRPRLAEAVREEWQPAELLALGDALLAKSNADGALVCFEVLRGANPADPAAAELDPRVDRCLLTAAQHAARMGSQYVDWRSFARAEELYEDLLFRRESFAQNRENWRQAAAALLAAQVEWADRMSQNDLFAAAEQKALQAARKTAVALWRDRVSAAGADPWVGVPPAVRERIDRLTPAGDEGARRAALERAAERGDFAVPEAGPALAVRAKVLERSALSQVERALQDLRYKSAYDRALDGLRQVLRRYPGTEAATRAKEGLEEEIQRAQGRVRLAAGSAEGIASDAATRDFTALADLLGFYVAEVGPPKSEDPFRTELKASLTDAATLAGQVSPLTRVFLLSLLADALPDDDAGRQAGQDALAKGIEIMGVLPPNAPPASAQDMPSRVPGFSSARIGNRTPYHLLVFFQGPETFYARLNPFSRGSLVLKDGDYDVAVIVTREDVRPYRGQRSYQGVTKTDGYVIARTGPGETPTEELDEREVSGDFRLLRAPGEAGPLFIDPDSGLVIGAGGGK